MSRRSKREPLNEADIASFFVANNSRKKTAADTAASVHQEGAMTDEFWLEVAELLNKLERHYPWRVRKVRASLRWLFYIADRVQKGQVEL